MTQIMQMHRTMTSAPFHQARFEALVAAVLPVLAVMAIVISALAFQAEASAQSDAVAKKTHRLSQTAVATCIGPMDQTSDRFPACEGQNVPIDDNARLGFKTVAQVSVQGNTTVLMKVKTAN
ncbi:MAG: hypothetical protein HWE23_12825 [Rhodobacteraceae bacterium]|nr:hypothetical protein [Paracoccaceae bacterium]